MKIRVTDFQKDFASNITMTAEEFGDKFPSLLKERTFEEWKNFIAEGEFYLDCGICEDWKLASDKAFVNSDSRYDAGEITIGEALKRNVEYANETFIEACKRWANEI